jgi:hypothetical protein
MYSKPLPDKLGASSPVVAYMLYPQRCHNCVITVTLNMATYCMVMGHYFALYGASP